LLFGYPGFDDIEKTLTAPLKKEAFEKIDDVDSSDSDKEEKKKNSIKKDELAASAFMGEPSHFSMRGTLGEEEKME